MSHVVIFWGQLLRELRKSHHLNQEEIARVLHISRQDYSHIETGKVRPSPEIISILSNLYDKDLFTYALDRMPDALINEQQEFKSFIRSGLQSPRSDKRKPGSDKDR